MEVFDLMALTPEKRRELAARFAERRAREDEADESASSREEGMAAAFDRMRANKLKPRPADPATEAARRKVAATNEAGEVVSALIELSKKVQEGDQRAQEKIIRILDNEPHVAELLGDLSQRAEVALIESVSGDVFAIKLARARRAESIRRELLAACSTPLEKMAARNVVASWLQIQVIDENFASAAQRGVRLVEWTKMQERAAKRYQNAVRSLELATKASQALSRSSSTAATTPIATAATKAKAGKVRVRSKPAKRKPAATVADKQGVECAEQQHCDTPLRPRKGANRTTRRPANRAAEFVGASGAPTSSNGHANHDSPSAVGALNSE
jgi:hypothetical protein